MDGPKRKPTAGARLASLNLESSFFCLFSVISSGQEQTFSICLLHHVPLLSAGIHFPFARLPFTSPSCFRLSPVKLTEHILHPTYRGDSEYTGNSCSVSQKVDPARLVKYYSDPVGRGEPSPNIFCGSHWLLCFVPPISGDCLPQRQRCCTCRKWRKWRAMARRAIRPR